MSDKSRELIGPASGGSFKNREAAQSSMKQRGFTNTTHAIEGPLEDGGFMIRALPPQPKEKYYLVKFNARSSKSDPEDVMLSVNGEVLIMQRSVETIVPQRFLECADHATYNQFRSEPGRAHKVVAKIKTYPYQRLKEVTEKEYLKFKEEGTKIVKRNIKKYGFDASPQDVEE